MEWQVKENFNPRKISLHPDGFMIIRVCSPHYKRQVIFLTVVEGENTQHKKGFQAREDLHGLSSG